MLDISLSLIFRKMKKNF